jgi:hypothetical protein
VVSPPQMPSDSPGSLLQSSAASPGMPVLAVGAQCLAAEEVRELPPNR